MEAETENQEAVSVFYYPGEGDNDEYAIVIMDLKTFFEIWEIIDSWEEGTITRDDGELVTKEFLAATRAKGRTPMIGRTPDAEDLFKRFNIMTDKFIGSVRPEPDIPA